MSLHLVPDLGHYEIHLGALTAVHVGELCVVALRKNTFAGRLTRIPVPSQTKPLLVLQLGDISRALPPTYPVTVVPDGYRATVVVERRRDA